jgi:hypothetical protein
MPILENNNLSNSDEDWYCRTCTLPNFSDFYFDHNKSFDGTSDHEISYTGSLSNININIDTRELIQDDHRYFFSYKQHFAIYTINTIKQ